MQQITAQSAFRNILAAEIKRQKISVYRISKLSKVTAPAIHKILYGDTQNTSLETAIAICKALELNIIVTPKN
jgi:predicted transcriptional regulator